jgi:hypothetical protein
VPCSLTVKVVYTVLVTVARPGRVILSSSLSALLGIAPLVIGLSSHIRSQISSTVSAHTLLDIVSVVVMVVGRGMRPLGSSETGVKTDGSRLASVTVGCTGRVRRKPVVGDAGGGNQMTGSVMVGGSTMLGVFRHTYTVEWVGTLLIVVVMFGRLRGSGSTMLAVDTATCWQPEQSM